MVVGHAGTTGPHLLFYGHYDVQPVDPLTLWDRPPFDPELQDTPKGQVIRGRGTSDDKGQLMTFIEACRAWKAVHGTLPCRLTVFLEGEEESGSPSLIPFMRDNAAELRKLEAWRKEWYPSEHPLDSAAMQPKIGPLSLPAGTEQTPDNQYMKTILDNLNASISMEEEALTRSEHEGLKNLVTDIQSRQRRQIDIVREWLHEVDGKTPTP